MEVRARLEAKAAGDVIELPVALEMFGARPATAVASVRHRSLAARVGRALAALGIAWLLAFPAVFFPVAHFVLVPGFIVGGLMLAAMRLRETRTLARLRGTCPRCSAALDLTPGGRFHLPRPVQCVHCKNPFTLVAADRAHAECPGA